MSEKNKYEVKSFLKWTNKKPYTPESLKIIMDASKDFMEVIHAMAAACNEINAPFIIEGSADPMERSNELSEAIGITMVFSGMLPEMQNAIDEFLKKTMMLKCEPETEEDKKAEKELIKMIIEDLDDRKRKEPSEAGIVRKNSREELRAAFDESCGGGKSPIETIFRCKFCTEEFSNPAKARNHISTCQRNPANKQCCTCKQCFIKPINTPPLRCEIGLVAKPVLEKGLNPPCDKHEPWPDLEVQS